MSDLVLILPRCTVVGSPSPGTIGSGGEAVTRDWEFAGNAEPEVQSWLDQGVFDARNYVTSDDCEVVIDGVSAPDIVGAEITFPQNIQEHTPGGSKLTLRRATTYAIDITVTEYVTRDSLLFRRWMESKAKGAKPLEVTIVIRLHGPNS